VIVLDDAAVRRSLSPRVAVDAVREALAAQHAGRLSAPARVSAKLADGDLVFTAGRLAGVGYGFRAYDTRRTTGTDQLVAAFDDRTGEVLGVATGTWLGAARTGAIGAVAVDLLADPAASRLGLIGTGRQACTRPAATTLFCSLGLAGTEVAVAAALFTAAVRRAASRG
jgi:ornithine cyclodeaminase